MSSGFEKFLKTTLRASELLTEDEVKEALESVGDAPYHKLYAYAYRIAGFVTVYARQTAPDGLDEDDWQDAVQECMVEFPTILEHYSRSDAPFLRYVSRAFQNVISNYLWTLTKGGMGSNKTDAEGTQEFEEVLTVDEYDTEYTDESELIPSVSHPTIDPMDELISQEAVRRLVLDAGLARRSRGPKPEGDPISKREAREEIANRRKCLFKRKLLEDRMKA